MADDQTTVPQRVKIKNVFRFDVYVGKTPLVTQERPWPEFNLYIPSIKWVRRLKLVWGILRGKRIELRYVCTNDIFADKLYRTVIEFVAEQNFKKP